MTSSPLRQEVIFSSSDSDSTNDTSDSERSPPRPEVMKVGALASQPLRESKKTAFLKENSFLDGDHPLDEHTLVEKDLHPAANSTLSEEDFRLAGSLESAVWPIIAYEKHQIETYLAITIQAISTIIPKHPPGLLTHNRITEEKGGVDELLVETKEKLGDLTSQLKILIKKMESHLDRMEALERGMEKVQVEYDTLNRPSLAMQKLEGIEESETPRKKTRFG